MCDFWCDDKLITNGTLWTLNRVMVAKNFRKKQIQMTRYLCSSLPPCIIMGLNKFLGHLYINKTGIVRVIINAKQTKHTHTHSRVYTSTVCLSCHLYTIGFTRTSHVSGYDCRKVFHFIDLFWFFAFHAFHCESHSQVTIHEPKMVVEL